MSGEAEPPGDGGGRAFAARGVRAALSTPGLALTASAVGFGGLAQSLGWSLSLTVGSTAMIFALPAQLVMLAALTAGASLPATALAVTLSGVRLLPMTVSVMPLLRVPGVRPWKLYLASHFVAMTIWLESFRHLPELPDRGKLPFYFGMASVLLLFSTAGTAAGFLIATWLSAPLAVGLVAVTPFYFLYSLERGATSAAERMAIVIGFVLGPLAAIYLPGLELLVAGVIGGTVPFLIERRRARRPAP